MRRALLFIVLICLTILFFWQIIASFTLKIAVRSHLGCALTLREIQYKKGHFILKDVLLVDEENGESVRAEEIQINLPMERPFHVQVSLYRPHLVLQITHRSFHQFKEPKLKCFHVGVEVKKGSFELYKDPDVEPLIGSFDYSDHLLCLRVGEGSLLAKWISSEKVIDCEMLEWPLAPCLPFLTKQLTIVKGTLNGTVRFSYKNECIDQLNVEFQEVLIEKGKKRQERLAGTIHLDSLSGLSWRATGPSFLWEGKRELSNDFQTTLQMGPARGELSYSSSKVSLDISKADKNFVEWMQSFSPMAPSFQLEEGEVLGRFEWMIDQPSSIAGNVAIHGGKVRGNGLVCDDLFFNMEVIKGVIEQGYMQSSIHGLKMEADLFGTLKDVLFRGSLIHQEKAFFEGEIHVQDGQWKAFAKLSGIQWGLLQEGSFCLSTNSEEDVVEWSNVQGKIAIGQALFPLQGIVRQERDGLFFDLFLQHRFYDVARLRGVKGLFGFSFDSEKSHILGSPLRIQECELTQNGMLASLQIQSSITFTGIQAGESCLRVIDPLMADHLLKVPLSGACFIDVNLHPLRIRLQGDGMCYQDQPFTFFLDVTKEEDRWNIEQLQAGSCWMTASLLKEEDRWRIEQGKAVWIKEIATFQGYLTSKGCDLSIESIAADLSAIPLPDSLLKMGRVEGAGYFSLEWEASPWTYELDFDLSSAEFQFKGETLTHDGPMQLHFSDRKVLSIRGLNLDTQHPFIHSRIELAQFDVETQSFHLHHVQLRLPARSLSYLPFSDLLDQEHDLECIAEIDMAADLSSFSCSMKEGFVPLLGAVRHVQNVRMTAKQGAGHLEMQAIHQGHSLGLGVSFRFDPNLCGILTLEDEEDEAVRGHALTIHWEMDEGALKIHSIEGAFGGLDASFCEVEPGILIGRASLDFSYLSELLPSRMGKVFSRIKMGKGYEIKGKLFTNQKDLGFEGWLSGKSCELFGVHIRTLLARLSLNQTQVHLSNIKASDSAGILKIDELMLQREGEEGPWSISSPVLSLEEFRPSLLQKIGREPGLIGPLVVRELTVTDLKGLLEDSNTYSAKGVCSFINSFKREHTVFDLPADFLGRIFGLDLELLIPVTGKMNFELKEGRVWLNDLQEAYSEGKRSKFFLVKEGLSPSIDLDGHLNIFVKMKQYVLFKITEHFLLSIDGTLAKPAYHLQKKSKIFGS